MSFWLSFFSLVFSVTNFVRLLGIFPLIIFSALDICLSMFLRACLESLNNYVSLKGYDTNLSIRLNGYRVGDYERVDPTNSWRKIPNGWHAEDCQWTAVSTQNRLSMADATSWIWSLANSLLLLWQMEAWWDFWADTRQTSKDCTSTSGEKNHIQQPLFLIANHQKQLTVQKKTVCEDMMRVKRWREGNDIYQLTHWGLSSAWLFTRQEFKIGMVDELSKDYEYDYKSEEAFIHLAMITIMLRRIEVAITS